MNAKWLFVALFIVLLPVTLTGTSRAQYMYLDSNGDGVWTTADRINPNGTPTTVAAWVNTNHNRNGSLAICDTGDGDLGIWNSYAANLVASGGTVTYASPVNNQTAFTIPAVPFLSNATEMTYGNATGSPIPGGLQRMFTITITGVSGSPSIGFLQFGTLAPDATSFGTPCSGNDFDNTYKYQSDWFDVDGLGAGVVANLPPVIMAPLTVAGSENTAVSITGSASDPDGQNVTLTQTNTAAFLTGPASAGPATNPSITLTGTPSFTQSGTYTISWSATDGAGGSATATTTLTIANQNRNPVITVPASVVSPCDGSAVSVTGSATDPDGQLVTLSQTNNAPFLFGPASAGPSLNPSITLTGTPNFTQSGTYTINWSAVDNNTPTAGSVTARTTMYVSCTLNRNPVITAPATVSGTENTAVAVTGSATDPDGQNVTLSQTNNALFLTGPASAGPSLNPSITLTGTPSFTQSGTYAINWTAADSNIPAGTAAAITSLFISNVCRGPVITAPATASGTTGSSISVTASAVSPDGALLILCQTNNAPFFPASGCTDPALNPSITLTGTPMSAQSGTYTIVWSTSGGTCGTATATTRVSITREDQVPSLVAPADTTVNEGQALTFTVYAFDLDGDHVTLSSPSKPLGSTFVDNGNNTGTFSWTPDFVAGTNSYTVTFTGSDGRGGTASATTTILVQDVNRPPIADPNGPYFGVVNSPVTFDGSGSFDPDGGDLLTYSWDFGDGSLGTFGPTPAHTYLSGGLFTVTLTVTDVGGLSGMGATTAQIDSFYTARAFTSGGNGTVSLSAGKPYTCVQIEPIGGSYSNSDVDLSSIKMVSLDTGTVSEIFADASKITLEGDKDRNGITEITACFIKADLRQLFSLLPAGRNTVQIEIVANVRTGGILRALLNLTVKSTGGALAMNIAPNPLNPQAKVSFATSKPGAIRVQMFDAQGRLVKTVAEEQAAAAGYHDFMIDGTGTSGSKVASGVYFVKLWTQHDGEVVQAITILK